MMTPHQVFRYLVVVVQKRCTTSEVHPNRENYTRRSLSETQVLPECHDESGLYEIRLKGHLNKRWADHFEGLTITLEEDGHTLLTGLVVDQAALHGLLKKVRDLGMPLVSVSSVESSQADQSDVK
jgi:hypothetical protein